MSSFGSDGADLSGHYVRRYCRQFHGRMIVVIHYTVVENDGHIKS